MAPPRMRLLGAKDFTRTPGIRATGTEPWTTTEWDKVVQDNPILKAVMAHDKGVRARRDESIQLHSESKTTANIGALVDSFSDPTIPQNPDTMVSDFELNKEKVREAGLETIKTKSGADRFNQWFEPYWAKNKVEIIGVRQRWMHLQAVHKLNLAMDIIRQSNGSTEEKVEEALKWWPQAAQILSPAEFNNYRDIVQGLKNNNVVETLWITDYKGDWTKFFDAIQEAVANPDDPKSQELINRLPPGEVTRIWNQVLDLSNKQSQYNYNAGIRIDENYRTDIQQAILNARENNLPTEIAQIRLDLRDRDKYEGMSDIARLQLLIYSGAQLNEEEKEAQAAMVVPFTNMLWDMVYNRAIEGTKPGWTQADIVNRLNQGIAQGWLTDDDDINAIRKAASSLSEYRSGNLRDALEAIDAVVSANIAQASNGILTFGINDTEISVIGLEQIRAKLKRQLKDWVQSTGEPESVKILQEAQRLMREAQLTSMWRGSRDLRKGVLHKTRITNLAATAYHESIGVTYGFPFPKVRARGNFATLPSNVRERWRNKVLGDYAKIDAMLEQGEISGIDESLWSARPDEITFVRSTDDTNDPASYAVPVETEFDKTTGVSSGTFEDQFGHRERVELARQRSMLFPALAERVIQSSILQHNPDVPTDMTAVHPYNSVTVTQPLYLRDSPVKGDNQIVYNGTKMELTSLSVASVIGVKGKFVLVKVELPARQADEKGVSSIVGWADFSVLRTAQGTPGFSMDLQARRMVPGQTWAGGNNENYWTSLANGKWNQQLTVLKDVNINSFGGSIASLSMRVSDQELADAQKVLKENQMKIDANIVKFPEVPNEGVNYVNPSWLTGTRQ